MTISPLVGKRVVITRAEEQASELAAQLRSLGAEPLICPAITIAPPIDLAPLDTAITQLTNYNWLVFTSTNAVQALLNRITQRNGDVQALQHIHVAAVGPATARALRECGIVPQFTPSPATADAIVAEIGDVEGQRVLFPCADIARETLPQGLRERGAWVDEVITYCTVPGTGTHALLGELQRDTVDAVTFFSPSAVRYVLDGLTATSTDRVSARDALNRTTLVYIGPTTAAAAEREGLHIDATAREHTSEGVVAALVEWFEQPTPR